MLVTTKIRDVSDSSRADLSDGVVICALDPTLREIIDV